MKIGLIGLDTSHVSAFAKLLNDESAEYSVSGGKIVAAFPGGSPDFDKSHTRVEGFTKELQEKYQVTLADSPRALAEQVDAVLLTSVDGRVHREQFAEIAPVGKPVFIDKPFAVSRADAEAIAGTAKEHNVAVMSASSLRFAQPLVEALADNSAGDIFGADTFGPMQIEPTQGGLFWYGIHSVEMLYAALGTGCTHVTTTSNDDHDVVVGVWEDGRVGTVRGNRKGNNRFGALVHRAQSTQLVDASSHPKPAYASLLERVLEMFLGAQPAVPLDETVEVIRFIEAANQSRKTGKTVAV